MTYKLQDVLQQKCIYTRIIIAGNIESCIQTFHVLKVTTFIWKSRAAIRKQDALFVMQRQHLLLCGNTSSIIL